MTLRLPGALLAQIRRQGETAFPAECCGALVGRADGEGTKDVARLAPLMNRRADDPHRYLIDPEDLRRLASELGAEGLEIVGYYHSHPDHPARPSAFDIEHAWPWYSYLIVRIDRGDATDAASWVLDDDRPLMHPGSLEVLSEV
jgi:proteasome lid subunit RPN8/RPN11